MKKGDVVTWKWGDGSAEGTVASVHTEPTTIKSKGKDIKRNGSTENPAIVIEQESGTDIIKLQSELNENA